MATRATRLVRRAVRRFRGAREQVPARPTAPLVSVIVPVYNVEEYVAECLESVLSQTHAELDVVVVDDGGTDASMDVVRRVCAGDPRVRIVSQPNAGLGAARNTGIRVARGEFLRFVDSDDVLTPDSVEVLLASLLTSGSDFVVGNLRRLEHGRTWVPEWARQVHRVDRRGIGLDDLPDVLKDPFAHNKLFRTDFFHRVIGGFPEGVRYEDQEPSSRAYAYGRFDVLRAVVYHWRVREDGTSITQQKSNPDDLRERLEVKERVAAVLSEGASPQVFRHWSAKAVGFDMRPYYEQVPRTGPEFYEQLRQGVLLVSRFLDEQTWQQIPMMDRLLALATLRTGRPDVVRVLTRRETHGWEVPAHVEDGVALLDESYLADLDLALHEGLRTLAPTDVAPQHLMTRVALDGEHLVVEGHAHLRSLDAAGSGLTIGLALVDAETGERTELEVRRREDWRADLESKDAWSSFASSGFVASASLGALPRLADGHRALVLRLSAGSLVQECPVRVLDHRVGADRLPFGPLEADGRWVLDREEDGALGLRWLPVGPVRLLDATVAGDEVRLEVSSDEDVELVARAPDGTRVPATPVTTDGARRTLVLRLPAATGTPEPETGPTTVWRLRATTSAGSTRLFWPGSSAALEADDEVALTRLRCSREGTVSVVRSAWAAVVDAVSVRDEETDEVVDVRGRLDAEGTSTWSAALEGDAASVAVPVELAADGVFTVSLPLRTPSGRRLVDGAYAVTLTRGTGSGQETAGGSAPLEASAALLRTFPHEPSSARRALTVDRNPSGERLRVRLRRPYADDERGRLAQRRLGDLLATPPDEVDATTVVFEAFSGTRVADSPLALCEELRERHPGWTLCWSLAELTTAVPEGTVPLLRGSRAWAETLRSAGHLVNNANFPHAFRKHEPQRYLQTWHGTPLKRIGRDMPLTNLSLSYRALMDREAGWWDALVAQSPWAGRVLAQALGFDGRVLDGGYPRNDVLVDGQVRRKQVRQELGLDDDHHVVLYAPTWRDDVRTRGGRYALVSHLDPARAGRALGDVTILLRGHSNTAVVEPVEGSTVVDVTLHPDVNDLMLAADALVTDYSSVMFDFAVTGKPMYFLVPDLEHYGSRVRGFYFDLAEAAPGPVCLDEDELVAALRDREGYEARWAERYAAFVERFAPHDDGRATARVVDAFFDRMG